MGPKKEAKVDVIDNCDGTYSVNLQPKEPGKHVLEIKYDNEHIQNSPYLVRSVLILNLIWIYTGSDWSSLQ